MIPDARSQVLTAKTQYEQSIGVTEKLQVVCNPIPKLRPRGVSFRKQQTKSQYVRSCVETGSTRDAGSPKRTMTSPKQRSSGELMLHLSTRSQEPTLRSLNVLCPSLKTMRPSAKRSAATGSIQGARNRVQTTKRRCAQSFEAPTRLQCVRNPIPTMRPPIAINQKQQTQNQDVHSSLETGTSPDARNRSRTLSPPSEPYFLEPTQHLSRRNQVLTAMSLGVIRPSVKKRRQVWQSFAEKALTPYARNLVLTAMHLSGRRNASTMSRPRVRNPTQPKHSRDGQMTV